MGKTVEYGIKKKQAIQAALVGDILMHRVYGPVQTLQLELVAEASGTKTSEMRANVLRIKNEMLLLLEDLRLLDKNEAKAIKGVGLDVVVQALDAAKLVDNAVEPLQFSDLTLLQPFKVDDSGDQFIKVGNTAAIRTRLIQGQPESSVQPLFVRVDQSELDSCAPEKFRFQKTASVWLVQ